MPAHAQAAFELFYALGVNRSVKTLFDSITTENWPFQKFPTLKNLSSWQVKYRWGEQCKRREREDFEISRQAAKAELETLARKRIFDAESLRNAGLVILDKAELENLSITDARDLLPTAKSMVLEAMKIERYEYELVSQQYLPPKPIEDMSDDELEKYITQMNKEKSKA